MEDDQDTFTNNSRKSLRIKKAIKINDSDASDDKNYDNDIGPYSSRKSRTKSINNVLIMDKDYKKTDDSISNTFSYATKDIMMDSPEKNDETTSDKKNDNDDVDETESCVSLGTINEEKSNLKRGIRDAFNSNTTNHDNDNDDNNNETTTKRKMNYNNHLTIEERNSLMEITVNEFLDDFRHYLKNLNYSDNYIKQLIRKVYLLVNGHGIKHPSSHKKGFVFKEGINVTLVDELEKVIEDAKNWYKIHGQDLSGGVQLMLPLRKMLDYQIRRFRGGKPLRLQIIEDDHFVEKVQKNKVNLSKPLWTVPTDQIYIEEKQIRILKINEVTIQLEVDKSEEPNAGDGLFLTYVRGKESKWRVPSHGFDLGTYAPHRPEDIKKTVVFEAKNFLFGWSMQEWSFEGFETDQMLDITDNDGQICKHARDTLLPKVNEVLDNKRKQNVEPQFHGDFLHYVLSAGTTFVRGKREELFTAYGKKYEGVRKRKYFLDSNCEIGTVPAFTSIISSIAVYTERDVEEVMDYFLSQTPNDSEARSRMIWATEQIQLYCTDILFWSKRGRIKEEIQKKMENVQKLFPRPGNKEDMRVIEQNQYLGYCVRKYKDNTPIQTGIVEKVNLNNKLEPPTYKVAFKIRSKLSTQLLQTKLEFEEWKEEEIENCCFLVRFGAGL